MSSVACEEDPVLEREPLREPFVHTVVGQPDGVVEPELCRCGTLVHKLLAHLQRQLPRIQLGVLLRSQDAVVEDDADHVVADGEHGHGTVVVSCSYDTERKRGKKMREKKK